MVSKVGLAGILELCTVVIVRGDEFTRALFILQMT